MEKKTLKMKIFLPKPNPCLTLTTLHGGEITTVTQVVSAPSTNKIPTMVHVSNQAS